MKDNNCYLQNIYRLDYKILNILAKDQTNENRNFRLIDVSMFSFEFF